MCHPWNNISGMGPVQWMCGPVVLVVTNGASCIDSKTMTKSHTLGLAEIKEIYKHKFD